MSDYISMHLMGFGSFQNMHIMSLEIGRHSIVVWLQLQILRRGSIFAPHHVEGSSTQTKLSRVEVCKPASMMLLHFTLKHMQAILHYF